MPSNTLYHPYQHSPSALTEYLKGKLRKQRAKQLSRSHQLTSSEASGSDVTLTQTSTLAATNIEHINRRGEQNIPKRYLKEADWCEDSTLGAGYYVADPDDPAVLIPIDFNFKYLQWGYVGKLNSDLVLIRLLLTPPHSV